MILPALMGRGGKREGAGRPREERGKTVRINVRIEPSLLADMQALADCLMLPVSEIARGALETAQKRGDFKLPPMEDE